MRLSRSGLIIGPLAFQHLHRRPWRNGFRLSWWHSTMPPRVTFIEVQLQWGGRR